MGAGLEFLFDPRAGHRRRTYLRDRLRGTTRRSARRSRRFVRMLGSYGRGYGSRVFHRRPVDRTQPDDVTLASSTRRHIAGVRDVENLLHLPGTPAPMHE